MPYILIFVSMVTTSHATGLEKTLLEGIALSKGEKVKGFLLIISGGGV